jgi:hypothetical protein
MTPPCRSLCSTSGRRVELVGGDRGSRGRVALRLAYWTPLGCLRSASCTALLSIVGVNPFATEFEVPQAVGAVAVGTDGDQMILLVLLVRESGNAKHARRVCFGQGELLLQEIVRSTGSH